MAKGATEAWPGGRVVPARPSTFRLYATLAVLVAAYMLSVVDRMIITMLVDPIRASLQLSDFQVSIIYGAAFSLCYVLIGVPAGRLSDHHNRRNLIIGGILVWSIATAGCGLAASFLGLFVARVGVGVGESTLTPSAHSLLSEQFPPERRARVLGVYTSALYLGAAVGTFGAGLLVGVLRPTELPLIGLRAPWQLIMLGLGLIGLPMMLLMLTVRDGRGRGDDAAAGRRESASFRAVLGHIWAHRGAYLPMTFGLAILGILTQGAKAWIPTFMMRTYGWSPADVGLWFGLALAIGGAGGVISGGIAAQWLRRRHLDANVRVGMFAALATAPFGIAAPLVGSGGLSMALLAVVIFLSGMPFGAAVAAIMALSPPWMRGQASSLFLLGVNLIALALGPMVVAIFTDFVFRDDHLIRYSLASLMAVTALPAAAIIRFSLKPYRDIVANGEF